VTQRTIIRRGAAHNHQAWRDAQSSGVTQCTIIRRGAMHNHQAWRNAHRTTRQEGSRCRTRSITRQSWHSVSKVGQAPPVAAQAQCSACLPFQGPAAAVLLLLLVPPVLLLLVAAEGH
jgi:hypothetical protein